MRGFQPAKAKAKAQPFANGGRVHGPGTGTSDDIKDEVPEGSYIMPADSTAAVGDRALASMGARGMPVNLSNGEFKMPPEQVHAVGVQALDHIKNATHTPAGFAPGAQQSQEPEPRMFFADGGVVGAGSRPAFRRQNVDLGAWAQQQDQERNAKSQATLAQAAASDEQDQANAAAAPVREAASATPSPNQTSPSNIFPQSSPAAGAPIYQGAGFSADQFGSSGQFAQVPASIGQQPGRQPAPSAPDPQQGAAAVGFSPARQAQRPPDPVTGVTPASQAQQVMPGVFRSGNSYGDSATVGVLGVVPATQAAAQVSAPDAPTSNATAGMPPAPAAPAVKQPAEPARVSPTALYAVDGMDQMGRQIDAGNPWGAAGTGLRTAGQTVGMAAIEAVNRVTRPVLSGLGRFAGGFLGTDDAAGNILPEAGAKTSGAPAAASAAGGGRGAANPAPVNPSAPAPVLSLAAPPGAAAPSSDVSRVGNSYSGANITGDITINGQPPRGFGQVSDKNMAAADALAARNAGPVGFDPTAVRSSAASAGSARGFSGVIGQSTGNGNMWSRNPEQQRRDAQVQASSIHRQTSARGFAALQNLNVQDALATREAGETARAQLRDAGETGRTRMREDGAAQRSEGELGLGYGRLGTDRARLDIERTRAAGEERARGFPIRAAERLEGLQQQYVNSTDETQRAQLARRIREVQGNAPSADWGVQVTPAAKNADGSTSEGSVIRYNKSTGQVERVGAGAQPSELPSKDALVKGQVYQTARGPARWNGAMFDPA